ncbi:MAG: hypothetical protein JRF37_07565 [Deltaproteobacteria bacterium]|nr:hypothetical protein [Deltaproteobacteria bacterium]
MNKNLSQDEVGILIRGKKILRAKGLPMDTDVTSICEAAGISRKTGYQWAGKLESADSQSEEANSLRQENDRLKREYAELKKHCEDLRFENEGRKIAWKIHGIDEFIADKKKVIPSRKKQKR